jgi:hypothetical protein
MLISALTTIRKSWGAVASAFAVTLAASSPGFAVSFLSTSAGEVGTIDTATGIFTPLIIQDALFDIAFSETQGLFGVTPNRLFSIDLDTSTINQLGNFGLGRALGFGDFQGVNALGFDNNDQLFATGIVGNVYTIPTSRDILGDDDFTNDIALVSRLAPEFVSVGDIAFNPETNEFFATSVIPENSTLFSIGLDGTATEIGNIGFVNVGGLLFENGTLFGYTGDGQQIRIDLETGVGTFDQQVTGINGQIFGAASSVSTTSARVPEPASVLGLLVLGAVSAGSVLKRKQ